MKRKEILEVESVNDKYSLVLKIDDQHPTLTTEEIKLITRKLGHAVDTLRFLIK